MFKMDKKGAIELSVNVIITIIIAIAIVSSGLILFNKMIGNAQMKVRDIDAQTQDKIKSIMLSNNYKVAVYPNNINIVNGKGVLVGIGVTNEYSEARTFFFDLNAVYFVNSSAPGQVLSLQNQKIHYTTVSSNLPLSAKKQGVYSVLITLDSDAPRGQYVVTSIIKSRISTLTSGPLDDYDVVKIYVDNT